MAGDASANAIPWATTKTTPSSQTAGVEHKTKFVALAKYQVNVRSFHPNEQFEKEGFRFRGDNRGFSLGESYYGKKRDESKPTSRIWERYTLDMALSKTGDLTQDDENSHLEKESNPSHPGPGLYRLLGIAGEQDYSNPDLKPRGKLAAVEASVPHGGQKVVAMTSWYGGENYAATLSVTTDAIAVPTLDVYSDLWIRLERIKGYMDILSLVHGDGFPNCEAFITDSAGSKLYLGTHVRIGFPLNMLPGANHRFMWANTLRVEVDEQGNFGEKLWVFAHVLGGPPELRHYYPTSAGYEVCKAGAKPMLVDSEAGLFAWDCGSVDDIDKKNSSMAAPLHLSAYKPVGEIQAKMQQTWEIGPAEMTTRTQWNNHHLHRDPNEGRRQDDYDVSPKKWQE